LAEPGAEFLRFHREEIRPIGYKDFRRCRDGGRRKRRRKIVKGMIVKGMRSRIGVYSPDKHSSDHSGFLAVTREMQFALAGEG
jgi:hypothetical protein